MFNGALLTEVVSSAGADGAALPIGEECVRFGSQQRNECMIVAVD